MSSARQPKPHASTHVASQATGNEPSWPCLRTHKGSHVLDVSVSPNAKRTEVHGLHDGALRIRLAAPPVDGQANSELIKWLAVELDIAQRNIEILRGLSSKRKQLSVQAELGIIQAWLKKYLT